MALAAVRRGGSCRAALRGVCAVSFRAPALLVDAVPAAAPLARVAAGAPSPGPGPAEPTLAQAANGDVLEITKLPLGASITWPESISLRQVFAAWRLGLTRGTSVGIGIVESVSQCRYPARDRNRIRSSPQAASVGIQPEIKTEATVVLRQPVSVSSQSSPPSGARHVPRSPAMMPPCNRCTTTTETAKTSGRRTAKRAYSDLDAWAHYRHASAVTTGAGFRQ